MTLQNGLTQVILARRHTFRMYPESQVSNLEFAIILVTPYWLELEMRNIRAAVSAITISCNQLQMKRSWLFPFHYNLLIFTTFTQWRSWNVHRHWRTDILAPPLTKLHKSQVESSLGLKIFPRVKLFGNKTQVKPESYGLLTVPASI